VLKESIIPTMATLSKDPIPNIRFNVAKGFAAALPNLRKFEMSGIVNDVVLPRLNSMSEDGDGDVRFYAIQALGVGA
jgi:serine/threonine-protein phosphatase 2A regulatory subunit A